MELWQIILIVVVVVGLLVVRWELHRRRVGRFTAFAAKRGWHYAERDRDLPHRYQGTPFGRGSSRRATHVLEGRHRDHSLIAFEYTYQEGGGDNRTTVTHQVVAVTTPAARPTLEVGREGLGRMLLGLVGVHDLQLESEEFNQTFLIRTEDDKFAYDVLHPRMMEWLLADQRALELPFRFEGTELLTWDRGKLEPDKLPGMLDYLCDVLDRVPAFVWKSG